MVANVSHLVEQFSNRKLLLILLEVISLAVLVGLILWATYPLLEEWGTLQAFQAHGIAYFWNFIQVMPARPLVLVGFFLQWVLGNGELMGVAIATAVLAVARYIVARWAVSPLLSGHARWVVAISAASLPLWPAAWYGRWISAQLTAALFFLVVGLTIRQIDRPSRFIAMGTVLTVFVLLCVYQALAALLLVLPLIAVLWLLSTSPEFALNEPNRQRIQWIGLPILLGFGFYLAYFIILLLSTDRLGGGEGSTLDVLTRQLSVPLILSMFNAPFFAAWGDNYLLLPLFLFMVFTLLPGRCGDSECKLRLILISIMTMVAVAILPILALPYLNLPKLNDPDRVLFPVSTGFVLIVITILTWLQYRLKSQLPLFTAGLFVIGILTVSLFSAFFTHDYKRIQETVLSQMSPILAQRTERKVLLKDETGILGDVYTLYNPIVSSALSYTGTPVSSAEVCTPVGVDRLHNVARRFPLLTTKRCEDMVDASTDTVVLIARLNSGGEILIVPK